MNISVKDLIGSEIAVDAEDGDKVRARIREGLDRGETVTVSLRGLKHVITLFLNSAVGQLYETYKPALIDAKVRILARDAKDDEWINLVMDRARAYYHDPETRKALEELFDIEHA